MRLIAARLLAPVLLSVAGCASVSGPAPAPAVQPVSVETVTLTAPDARKVPVLVVVPAKPRGVVLFSHGGGSPLAGYRPVIDRLVAAGYAVAAPTYTDSADIPQAQRTSLQAAFATRVTDIAVTSGYAGTRFAGLPQAAVGHSYGALTSLMAGGAYAPMVPGTVPAVRAVVMFSSPGPIPGLSQAPGALDQVKVPTLLVTGTADTVPGFVPDPAAHLYYLDKLTAGDHTALIVRDAAHDFLAGSHPAYVQAWDMVVAFLDSRLIGDAKARTRFDSASGDAAIEVRRR